MVTQLKLVKPNLVKVNGAVNNPGSFQFISGQTLKDYIDLAGGYDVKMLRGSLLLSLTQMDIQKSNLF